VRTGIGKAAALALADEEATATLTGRRRNPLQDVIKQIALSGIADIQPVGLMDFEHVRTIDGHICNVYNRLDSLMNNARINSVERYQNSQLGGHRWFFRMQSDRGTVGRNCHACCRWLTSPNIGSSP
jgi:NADP-dependent 3-hydroxy acid dehydrogenase YdfG